jgi:hypothetical protein
MIARIVSNANQLSGEAVQATPFVRPSAPKVPSRPSTSTHARYVLKRAWLPGIDATWLVLSFISRPTASSHCGVLRSATNGVEGQWPWEARARIFSSNHHLETIIYIARSFNSRTLLYDAVGGTLDSLIVSRIRCDMWRSCRCSTMCQAQPSSLQAPAPLAVYPFANLHERSPTLFSDAFEEIVSHLASAPGGEPTPFFQMSPGWPAVSHKRVPSRAWSDISKILPDMRTNLLMFVKQIEDPMPFCGACKTSCDHWNVSDLLDTTLHGTAGDCCDDAASDHSHDEHHEQAYHRAQRLAENPDMSLDKAYSRDYGLSVKYYGLIAQSRNKQLSDGCYLLKTVQQVDGAACHCMHYSLMRVCQGEALADQVRHFWMQDV